MQPDERHSEIARSLFREANDAFFLFDPTTLVVLDLNPTALRLTRMEKAAARSLCLEDLFFSKGPDGLGRLVLALTQSGFFHSREGYFLRRSMGDPLPVNISVSRIHTDPEPIGLVVARDVSDRNRAEESLRQAEARYNSLVESTGVVILECDAARTFLAISPAFEAITGWGRTEWIGRPFDDLVHPEDLQRAHRLFAETLRGDAPPRLDLRIRARSGGYLEAEFLLATRIRQGPNDRVLGICRDLTEQKRAERALEEAASLRREKEAAEQASRAKSEFLSNVSHELRTPLSAILGFTELLGEHAAVRGGAPELGAYIETIRENGRVLLTLIDDLLDLSRIEAGQLRIEREVFTLPTIVADVLESLRARAEAKPMPLAIEVALDDGLPAAIAADRLRLQQILANLLDNAIKFTDRGTIRLAARLLPGGGPEPTLEVEVRDTGVGMSEPEMKGLFQPFYRARPLDQDAPPGTGLGLAICKRIARKLGGDVQARSVPNVGSTFTLRIPVRAADESDRSRDEGRVEPAEDALRDRFAALSGARILIAEDHPANRQVINLRLSAAGAEVLLARNGKEAIERVREAARGARPVDAIVMDMEMPVVDGYEAVRRLRADGFHGPILAVTAYAMAKDREECLGLGCDEHISKPIEWEHLLRTLAQLLEGEAARRAGVDLHAARRD